MGAQGEVAPEMPKRAPESHKRTPKICIEFNAKQIKECYFVAPKIFLIFFSLPREGVTSFQFTGGIQCL